jgi:hypothetical protein
MLFALARHEPLAEDRFGEASAREEIAASQRARNGSSTRQTGAGRSTRTMITGGSSIRSVQRSQAASRRSQRCRGARARLRSDLASSFSSIRFTLAFLLAQTLRETEQGRKLLENPQRFLPEQRVEVEQALIERLPRFWN